jgi:hypothetical protein
METRNKRAVADFSLQESVKAAAIARSVYEYLPSVSE